MSSHIAYLVLGTNLGNRYKNLSNARFEINKLPKTKILKKSKIFKSPSYGPIKQPFFFNLALEVETRLTPINLLENLQKIEMKLKREKNSHMKPRTIDIDIVFFDDETINTPLLKVPHYDWQNRNFFIEPLREVDCKAKIFKNFNLD
mgnify:FL=1